MLESSYKARKDSYLQFASSIGNKMIYLEILKDIFLLSQTMESELETLKSDHTILVEEHR